MDHVLLLVSNLERSLPYYRQLYGPGTERPRDGNGRVWFHLEKGTRIALEQAAAGQKPSIGHFAIAVAPFDRGALTTRLRELKADILPSADEPGVVRFRDNNGIIVEVRAP
jgi:catechol 2,3-dioxygenase-like lactoylglutathione lyase family enzyme